jgi:hypothetical protein
MLLYCKRDAFGLLPHASRSSFAKRIVWLNAIVTLTFVFTNPHDPRYNDESGRALGRFTRVPHSDHPAASDTLNLGNNFTASVGRLAALCLAHPRCVAFNSDGWLKSSAVVTNPSAPADLYVLQR